MTGVRSERRRLVKQYILLSELLQLLLSFPLQLNYSILKVAARLEEVIPSVTEKLMLN